MGQAIPRQHPAVVLRSRYRQLRVLLVIAVLGLVALGAALLIVANDDESTTTATPVQSIEYGGFNPQTGRPMENGPTAEAPKPGQPIEYGGFNPQTGRPMANGATPDESSIAAAVSGAENAAPTDEPSVSQAHPGARP